MAFLILLLHQYGNAGAVTNAEAELHLVRRRDRLADTLVGRLPPVATTLPSLTSTEVPPVLRIAA